MKLIKNKKYGLTMKTDRYEFIHDKEVWELESKAYLSTPGLGKPNTKGTMYTTNCIHSEMRLLKPATVSGVTHWTVYTIKEIFPNNINKFDKYLLTFNRDELIEASDNLQTNLPEIMKLAGRLIGE